MNTTARIGILEFLRRSAFIVLMLFGASTPNTMFAGGVTLITHGYNSDANSWVAAMASRIPEYDSFPGDAAANYKLTLTFDGSSYFYQWTRTGGSPSTNDSGEIVVKLDWSAVAGGFSAPYNRSTYEVAQVLAWALSQTNLISELNGHALAEFPLHLIGHSRGGSLISETSRNLGTNGIWVDHITTLDPHPLNNDGFIDPPSVVDAPVRTYSNVLFHDNYWQNLGLGSFFGDPNGEPVAGAYIRQLYDNSGGYSYPSGAHGCDWKCRSIF